ncbi:MAG: prolyl oligopeptidase family serine peptidase [Gemmatimonadota bacterium]
MIASLQPRSAHLALLILLALALTGGATPSQAQDKRVMGHEVYEQWHTIGSQALAPNGQWLHYTLELENGDGTLVFREVESEREIRISRGQSPEFTSDSRFALFRIVPELEAGRSVRRDGRPSREVPADTLGVLSLTSGEVRRIPSLRSFHLPRDGGSVVAYHLDGSEGTGTDGGPVVWWDLGSHEEHRLEGGIRYALSSNGELLLAVLQDLEARGAEGREEVAEAASDSARVQVVAYHAPSRTERALSQGRLEVPGLAVGRQGRRAAYISVPSQAEEGRTAPPEAQLLLWEVGQDGPQLVAEAGTQGLPQGWGVNRHGELEFSRSGRQLHFGTAPAELQDRPEPGLAEEEVRLDVWHWEDGDLMTVQRVNEERRRRQSYLAVAHLDEGARVVQLAVPQVPEVHFPDSGETRWAVGWDMAPYALEGSWESPNFRDIYKVDSRTGEAVLIRRRSQGTPGISPAGETVTWYEPGERAWLAHNTETGETVSLSQGIPHPVHDEDHDQPSPPPAYGSAGWTEGDRHFLIYDRYDVWAVDPQAPNTPLNLTGGAGRAASIRYRVGDLDLERQALPASGPLLLSAFREEDRAGGFSRVVLGRQGPPEELVLAPFRFSSPIQARESDQLLYTRESFREFPDLWVSGPSFRAPRKLSNANPQQEEYRWGDVELVHWTSGDGTPLDGILMKPDDFDPNRKYPLIVYFYERWSDGLHNHYAPVPHRSRIAFPMYTSRDYLVFIPDIVYRDGYPGEGAMNSVVPGVMHLLDRGYVDGQRMGLQGHSWGGYQIAFMVTRTGTLFKAAAPGAPVVNMTSAYGGIRRETGLVRQFQYERTQSRLGGNLWEMPLRYLENSPLFWVDRIETPLLIMHNDGDGHVPWEQGVEFFTALRRLGKPAWLLNYNDQPHWPLTFPNRRDFNIRLQQFFDHYLKDAPAPVWMEEGVPAIRRGETLGLEEVR